MEKMKMVVNVNGILVGLIKTIEKKQYSNVESTNQLQEQFDLGLLTAIKMIEAKQKQLEEINNAFIIIYK